MSHRNDQSPQHKRWWKASYSWRPELTLVKVVKEFPATLLILEQSWHNNRPAYEARVKKTSSDTGYFPTWEEAHAHLLKKVEERLQHARRSLEKAQSEYGNVKGMKAPADTDEQHE